MLSTALGGLLRVGFCKPGQHSHVTGACASQHAQHLDKILTLSGGFLL